MLAQKLEFLRKCFLQIPELKKYRIDGEALLSGFGITGKKRNDLVHGAITNLSIENGAFKFAKIDVNYDGHALRTVVLDQSEFSELIKELLGLGADANKFARKILDGMLRPAKGEGMKQLGNLPRSLLERTQWGGIPPPMRLLMSSLLGNSLTSRWNPLWTACQAFESVVME